MKVMERSIARIFPGKIEEAMKLLEEQIAIAKRYGMPPWRTYRPMIGGGDSRHTIVFEIEWDSLTAMVTFYEKTMADPEMQKQDQKWEAVGESHETELYMVMP